MKSPLHLKRHFVAAIDIKAAQSDDVSSDFSVTANPMIAHNKDDPTDWLIRLVVEIKGQRDRLQAAYQGKVEFVGQFQVDQSVPEERRLKVVASNGSSILYGAVREMVANLTARGPHPMITLPSLSFVLTETPVPGEKPKSVRDIGKPRQAGKA